MSIKKLSVFFSISLVVAWVLLTTSSTSRAQEQQEVETEVGNVDQGNPDGGDDGLGPGEFRIPWRCNLDYWSWTYSGHSPYSLDVNRGSGATDRGDPVFASADGVVYDRITSHGQIVIRHEGNYYTLYAHMQNIRVNEGEKVRMGDQIGGIGDYGAPGAYHLHVNHSRGTPYAYANRIKVCYKGYGCNPASLPSNDRVRYGTDYNNGCR